MALGSCVLIFVDKKFVDKNLRAHMQMSAGMYIDKSMVVCVCVNECMYAYL